MNSTLELDKIGNAPTRARVEDGHVIASVTFIEPDGSELTFEASTRADVDKLINAARALDEELRTAQAALGSSIDLRDGIRP